nr:MAG TPA: hypothetical protein [Caudoviricetes sp.]
MTRISSESTAYRRIGSDINIFDILAENMAIA